MKLFRSPVEIPEYDFRIGYGHKILSIGSCFAEEMASRMTEYRFDVVSNPFGILYNPASIAHALQRLLAGAEYVKKELFCDGKLWHSWDHHGSFSGIDPDAVLDKINKSCRKGHEQLLAADLLIVSFGTAGYYRLKSTDELVANCHKVPGDRFYRCNIDKEEYAGIFDSVFSSLKVMNPSIRILLTISPVRYLRDGLIQSFHSKSILNLLAHDLIEHRMDCYYFPSYEILVDELRDYRFYAEDMAHPSREALDYIWSRFTGALLDENSKELMNRVGRVLKALKHRPMYPDSPKYQSFRRQLQRDVAALKQETGIDLSK